MSRDLTKTLSYLVIHVGFGFTVAYLFTGSLVLAGGIALIDPVCNAVAYFFHEKLWNAWAPLHATVAPTLCHAASEAGHDGDGGHGSTGSVVAKSRPDNKATGRPH